jgi:hypothetical protein
LATYEDLLTIDDSWYRIGHGIVTGLGMGRIWSLSMTAPKTLGSSKEEAVQGEGVNGYEPVETWLLSSVGALKATDFMRVRRSFCVDFELFIGAVQGGGRRRILFRGPWSC